MMKIFDHFIPVAVHHVSIYMCFKSFMEMKSCSYTCNPPVRCRRQHMTLYPARDLMSAAQYVLGEVETKETTDDGILNKSEGGSHLWSEWSSDVSVPSSC